MKRMILSGAMIMLLAASVSHAGFFDDLIKGLGLPAAESGALDEDTIVRGLKEALATGTERAVKSVGRTDGYYGNQAIRILMPEKIRNVADVLGKIGFRKEVDDFVLSMNRAAEKAAPKAADYFVSALKEMSFDDAGKILKGGDTAATEYFRRKTGDQIFSAFKPIVSASMDEVGASRSYKQMIQIYESVPFVPTAELDLDRYVTAKSVEGLFQMLGEEEKKIRTNPAARATELLRKVFGK
ncbi:MAG: DUF4197 domain-containing protein [Steroidobacteraceae bacterium]|nr:DUF4197 domain-containing protein [Deltaproteobacteria bacterium]